MLKKIVILSMLVLCMSMLFGCQSTPKEPEDFTPSQSNNSDNHTVNTNQTENTTNAQKTNHISLFDSANVDGAIESIHYADGSRIFAYADSLILYDLATDRVVGELQSAEGRISDCQIYPISNGYAVLGTIKQDTSAAFSDSVQQINCWYFDHDFTFQKKIDLVELVLADGGNFVYSAAVSKDGNKIAIIGDFALYVYNVQSEQLNCVFRYAETSYAQDVSVSNARFIKDDAKLLFTGSALFTNSPQSIPIYGSVATDGNEFVCHSSEYALSNEVIAFENEVWLPEDAEKATGKMLVVDVDGKEIRTVAFEGNDSGADGVFASDNGKYLSTIKWVSDQSSWRIRIYNTENGSMVHEEMVVIDTEKYSTIVCKVRILDEWNECIVLAGRNRETLLTSFFFGS